VREEVTRFALKEGPTSGVLIQEKMEMVPDQQGPVPIGGGGARVGDGPT
jgi:hypothetical protein